MREQLFSDFLQRFVTSEGKVKYKEMKKSEQELEKILSFFTDFPILETDERNKQIAFWINVYNGFTLLLVLQNYPLRSLRELEEGKIWQKKWIPIGEKIYSLDDIEHHILRQQFSDPRLHFALNCASEGCPLLLNRAFMAESLEEDLTEKTKEFIQKQAIISNEVQLSKIFEWYKKDFGYDLLGFLNQYTEKPISSTTNYRFVNYDWELNEEK